MPNFPLGIKNLVVVHQMFKARWQIFQTYVESFMCKNSNPICLAFDNKGNRTDIEIETQYGVFPASVIMSHF